MSETQTNSFTFRNGREVRIKPVSFNTITAIDRSFPRPEPPVQNTDLGPEANYSHPDYLLAMNQWTRLINEKRLETLFIYGVEADIDQAALADFRAKAEKVGLKVPADDLMCYVMHVCVGTRAEDEAFQNALVEASIPTEQKISEAADGFKSPAEGQGHPEALGSEIGSDGR